MPYMGKKQAKGTSARKSKAATSSTDQSKVDTSAPTTPTAVTSASSNQSKTGVSSVPAPANKVHTMLYRYVYRLSKAAQEYVIKSLPLIVPSVVLMFLGFKPLPS